MTRNQLGDINEDGIVNILDIVRVINIILDNEPPPTDYELWSSDVNNDEAINVQDVIVLVSFILGTLDECTDLMTLCPNNLTQCCYSITNHDFNWHLEILGIGEGGIISDCSIISFSNILGVGSIQIEDVPGGDIANIVHWDGIQWNLLEIAPVGYPFVDGLVSIFSFSSEDIWAGSGGLIHYNGQDWSLYSSSNSDLPTGLGTCNHIWGYDDYMYHGRESGDIVMWDGEHFSIMATTTGSGTEFDNSMRILDLYGLNNENIWSLAGHPSILNDEYPRKLSYYNGDEWVDEQIITDQDYIDSELCGWMYNIWAFGDTLYISTANYGVWKESITTNLGYFFNQTDDQAFYGYSGLLGQCSVSSRTPFRRLVGQHSGN